MSVLDPAAIGGSKVWRLNAMEGEHLFGDRLVLGEEEGVRARSGVAQAKQVEISCDVHFFCVITRI